MRNVSREERGGVVAIGGVREDGDDRLAGGFRTQGNLGGGPEGGASRLPSSFAVAKGTSLSTGMISSYTDVSNVAGTKPAPMPWIL